MNKETKKFKEIIKKRKRRLMRLARPKKKKVVVEQHEWIETPTTWYKRLWNKIKLWLK